MNRLMEFNIQLFAHKKGQSSTSNGRDSAGRRLGAKASDGEYSEYKYLTHIVRDSIKNGQESVENNNNAKVAKSKEESEEER